MAVRPDTVESFCTHRYYSRTFEVAYKYLCNYSVSALMSVESVDQWKIECVACRYQWSCTRDQEREREKVCKL